MGFLVFGGDSWFAAASKRLVPWVGRTTKDHSLEIRLSYRMFLIRP